jgi:RimJ/RimL family protein N-acetyltransferase
LAFGVINMTFSLLQLSREELLDLANSRIPVALTSRVEAGALPPAFVAARSLEHLSKGKSQFWCNTFLVVRDADSRIVGGCGFKNEPKDGRVEIGYGVSPNSRGRGVATAAVKMLLGLAFAGGATEVLAEVSPENLASAKVVQKLGFSNTGSRVNEDNETVVQWVAKNDA